MSGLTFELRTGGDTAATVPAVRAAVQEIDSNLPIQGIKTQTEQADETLRMERLLAKLVTLFGVLAQQLAAIGLFGVMAYAVSQRTREIGIRMALGANRSDVLKMILKQGLLLALLGVGIGVGAAFGLMRLLSTLLYQVSATDASTFAIVTGTLFAVALLACFLPARRATKVDPLVALRYE